MRSMTTLYEQLLKARLVIDETNTSHNALSIPEDRLTCIIEDMPATIDMNYIHDDIWKATVLSGWGDRTRFATYHRETLKIKCSATTPTYDDIYDALQHIVSKKVADEKLYNLLDFIQNELPGAVIAGGSVLRAFLYHMDPYKEYFEPGDLDIWITDCEGHTQKQLLHDFFLKFEDNHKDAQYKFTYKFNQATCSLLFYSEDSNLDVEPLFILQFVFTNTPTTCHEIVKSFDISCCQIGIDTKQRNVIISSEFLRTILTQDVRVETMNVLYPSNMIHRIVKYANRGFTFSLPCIAFKGDIFDICVLIQMYAYESNDENAILFVKHIFEKIDLKEQPEYEFMARVTRSRARRGLIEIPRYFGNVGNVINVPILGVLPMPSAMYIASTDKNGKSRTCYVDDHDQVYLSIEAPSWIQSFPCYYPYEETHIPLATTITETCEILMDENIVITHPSSIRILPGSNNTRIKCLENVLDSVFFRSGDTSWQGSFMFGTFSYNECIHKSVTDFVVRVCEALLKSDI
jgi:hypothetical protein